MSDISSRNITEKPDSDIRKLVEECQKGDMKAFEKIYNIHKTKMYNIAVRMHSNEDEAADSFQEAFIKVYKNIGNFKFESSFTSWFYKILVNTCLDNIKKNKTNRRQNIDDVVEAYKINPESELLNGILEKEIQSLSPAYRTVFVLFEIEGFSHQEISGILSISVGTSKSNLFRAKEILKEKLKIYFDELHINVWN